LLKKLNFINLAAFFYFIFLYNAQANFKKDIIIKFEKTETLSFDFTQKIEQKIEVGNCQIKYPLLMKCYYPKSKKIIIANGKFLAIVKKKYKKVYIYPLEKTPLFFLLKKENIINMIKNNEPTEIDSSAIGYELTENDLYKVKILFDKNSLDIIAWMTTDSYSNEVIFAIENIKTNLLMEKEQFIIPQEKDL